MRQLLTILLLSLQSPMVLTAQDMPWPKLHAAQNLDPLPDSKPLDSDRDLSLWLLQSNDRFLDREMQKCVAQRAQRWQSIPDREDLRQCLREMIGLHRDQTMREPQFVYRPPIFQTEQWSIRPAQWNAFSFVNGYGYLIEPTDAGNMKGNVILLPDPDLESSDMLSRGVTLAASGCRVLIIDLIGRDNHPRFPMSLREWLHRPSFTLGRTLTGYEIHKVISAFRCLKSLPGDLPTALYGNGEGGRLALLTGALHPEWFAGVAVAGYFGPREALWNEPADRNLFGFLSWFGDAELGRLASEQTPLFVTSQGSPEYVYRPDAGGLPQRIHQRPKLPGKPGMIPEFDYNTTLAEWTRGDLLPERCVKTERQCLAALMDIMEIDLVDTQAPDFSEIASASDDRQVFEIENHNRIALADAAQDRKDYWKSLQVDTLKNFQTSVEPYREKFATEVIGQFDNPRVPFNTRSRPFQVGPKTVSYEVVLDVFDGLAAYGILTLPKGIDITNPDRQYPVVVCQHGLEGTPRDVIGEAKYKAYKAFATRLAEQGFVTFAPQNGYKYFDLFRIQQFKAQSIGRTLFSLMVPQHRQITDWLGSLDFVDAERIAFYGLSYGGKSAMRIPPLVDNYCLSICSADFNEWVWKNAATGEGSLRYSYANKGEYEIFEWNLGGTYNYAEMAYLIAPRPFMVERGHFDGVAPDERVAFEYAKVRNLYQAQLGIGDRCQIEWFVGPHSINGEATYDFLRKHLMQR